MNVGSIAIPNQKGQIVIPVRIREQVGIKAGVPVMITVTGQSLWLQPTEITPIMADDKAAFLDMLRKYRGFMAGDQNFTSAAISQRKKLELKRARENSW